MSRSILIKEAALEIILSSTSHGIPNVFRTKRIFHKLIWIISTVVSFAACAKYIYDGLTNYLEYAVVTNIETIYEQPTQFPTLSICSTDFSFRNQNLSQVMRRCWFNYDTACFNNPELFFEKYQDEDYSDCYRFNSGKKLPILNSNIGGMDDSFVFEVYTSTGLAVWVHNYTSPPKREFMNNHNGEINFAPSGFLSHLIVEKTFDNKLGEPYNSCLNDLNDFNDNKSIIDYIKQNNFSYNREYCLELCFDIYYIPNNECNCKNVTLGNVWKNCFSRFDQFLNSTKNCIMKSKIDFFKESVADKCSSYCPITCNSISYTVSTKIIKIGSSNFSSMFVYYKSLKYTSISQQPSMYISDAVSNIGGILGLFIGISFLSLIEIIEIFTEIIFILFSSESNKITNS